MQSSEAIVSECLEAAAQTDGQGTSVFIELYAQQAIEQATVIDKMRACGVQVPPCAGIPITVKDLFDISGRVTTAGSVVLRDREPALHDATAVQRLRQAGFVVIGKTNMTEFAYSGLGINPHYGTPLNPFDRSTGRIPGGSSSGAAVAVTDGFALGSVGTDTGGSCRIPAALCGIVGFKPTASRVPMNGVVPLSPSLDCVGPLAVSVQDCATLDSVLSGSSVELLEAFPLRGLRFAVPQHFVLDELDDSVSADFGRALSRLSLAGATITDLDIPELEEISYINRMGGFTASEAYSWHRSLLEQSGDSYDPRVSSRIRKGKKQSATDYIELLEARKTLQAKVAAKSHCFDAMICPTVPTIAPSIQHLAEDETYQEYNLLMLRNPSVANLLDRCSVSLPCHSGGTAPTGIMLIGERNDDKRLLSIAMAVESLLASNP